MLGTKLRLSAYSAGLVATFFTSTAFADCWMGSCGTGCMSVPCGWFIEANVGSSHISDVDFPGEVSTSGWGGGLNVGYKFMPYVALEIGATRYTNINIEFDNIKIATIKTWSYDIALRGIIPFAGSGFEMFAKIGAGRPNVNVSVENTPNRKNTAINLGLSGTHHGSTGLFYGVGAQYYLMPEFAIVVQWARVNGNSSTGNMDLLSAGISFIFD